MRHSILLIELEQVNHLDLILGLRFYFSERGYLVHLCISDEIRRTLNQLLVVRGHRTIDNNECVRMDQVLPKYKLVILCSSYQLRLDYLFWTITGRINTLVLHNVNASFYLNFRNAKYFIKTFYRLILRIAARNYLVLNPEIEKYLIHCCNVKNRRVAWFPFKYNLQYKTGFHREERTKIVYPGSIDFSKREYIDFIKLASLYVDIEFVVLGAFTGDLDRKLFFNLYENHGKPKNLIFFESRVSDGEYQLQISSATCLYSFIRVDFNFNEYEEVYGITKETGVIYDAILFNKCLIVNSDLQFPNLLRGLTKSFESFSVQENLIRELIKDKSTFIADRRIGQNYFSNINITKFLI